MECWLVKIVVAFLISFLSVLILVPYVCALAIRLRFVDIPDGIVKTHDKVTPYLGGIAVWIGFTSALLCTFPWVENFFVLFVGYTILLFVGLIDDLVALKPYQKILGQGVATLCFLHAGLYLKGQLFAHWWSIPLSALWILSVINAFNLVDVMDGLATLLALQAVFSFFIFALYMNLPVVALLLSCAIGSLCAFLWYNWPVAQIYLGDAGALFIGGFLATMPFLFNWGDYTPLGYGVPIIIIAIPLLELTSLILIRSYKGIPFYKPSPDHFAHYLLKKGWKNDCILIYTLILSIILFCSSFAFLTHILSFIELLCIAIFFIVGWFVALFYKR